MLIRLNSPPVSWSLLVPNHLYGAISCKTDAARSFSPSYTVALLLLGTRISDACGAFTSGVDSGLDTSWTHDVLRLWYTWMRLQSDLIMYTALCDSCKRNLLSIRGPGAMANMPWPSFGATEPCRPASTRKAPPTDKASLALVRWLDLKACPSAALAPVWSEQ